MIKLEKFDGTKTYMFPNSEMATPEVIRKKFPAVDRFVHIIEVNGDVCQAVMSLNALRSIHDIDATLSERAAIQVLEDKINIPLEKIVGPDERLAAAAEFQNILELPNTPEIDEMNDTVTRKNVKSGLWGRAHLGILVKKGLLTQTHADSLYLEER